VRLRVKIVDLTLGDREACVHIDAICFHASNRVRPAISNDNLPVFAFRSFVHNRAELTIVEALIALYHCWNFAHLHRWLLFGIRLNLEYVDRMANSGAISMSDIDAIAGDAETARITLTVEIATFPFTGGLVLHRGNRQHPMQMFEIAE